MSTSYNRVLISHFPCEQNFPGFTNPDGSPRPSLVGMILEEFVSLSASEIVVSNSVRTTFEEQVPRQLLGRVTYIDRTHADAKHAAFMVPLAAEFCVDLVPHRNVRPHEPLSEEIERALNILWLLAPDLFAGFDRRVQIHNVLFGLRLATKTLRESSRSPENRARLAALEGVLALYGDEQSPALVTSDLAAAATLGAFSRLLRDDLYQSLSEASFALGIPARSRAALSSMRERSQNLLQRSPLRHLFDLGSRSVAIATQVPMPNSQQTAELFGSAAYLPPLVEVHSSIKRAHKAFVDLNAVD